MKSFRPLCCLCSIVYTINQNQQPVMWWWLIQIFAATSPVKDSGRDASNFWPRKCIFGRSVTLLVLVTAFFLQHLVDIYGLTLSIENHEYGWNLCQKRKFRIQKIFFWTNFVRFPFFLRVDSTKLYEHFMLCLLIEKFFRITNNYSDFFKCLIKSEWIRNLSEADDSTQ